MGDLGDLLVLLHGARGRVSTVRAVVRAWQHVRVSREAMARRVDRGDVVAYAPADVPERESVESLVRVWLAPPDRAREEREGSHGEWLGVRRGRLWWRYDAHNGAEQRAGRPGLAWDEERALAHWRS